ncbi:MAG: alcohol dehydrogenase catalytic domain-containing protein [Deltaproteobacteria bacterium]|nr:alcohol dehydrogenase catalytic domain-containing protein [Deltaproteobacteria bacterium]
MKAARVHENDKIVIEDVPLPKLGEKDVLIKVYRVGICGTDVGVVHGYVPAKFPVTLGHEFSGTIAGLGSPLLGGFKEGDLVSAAGGWGCGECKFCRNGMVRFCKDRNSLGRTVDGCFAEFVRMDYRAVFKLPPNVVSDEGQNFLNIACVVRAFKKAPLQLGNRAVVFGTGNMGLIMLQILKITGASEAAAVDTIDFRLEMAKKFGANHVVNAITEDPVKLIPQWFPGGADVVVEATGNTSSFKKACAVIKPGGALINIGMYSKKLMEFDLSFLYEKEAIIYGSKGGEEGYEEAVELLAQKRLQITPMITHRFPLEETPKGFETFQDKTQNALRIIIEPSS